MMPDYSDIVMALSPNAYYRMDSTTTTITDVSGKNLHGTWPKAPVTAGTLAPNTTNAALSDGWRTDSYTTAWTTYSCPAGSWNNNAAGFSISLWVNPTALTDQSRLWAFRTSSATSGMLFVYNQGMLQSWDGSYRNFNNSTLTAGKTSHVAVTYDGTTFRVWVDGVNTDSVARTKPTLSANFIIGNGYNVGSVLQGFPGSIDEVVCFARALSPSEVWQLYTGNPAPPSIDGFGLFI